MPLFVKKSDDEGIDFYYLGELAPLADAFQEDRMASKGGKPGPKKWSEWTCGCQILSLQTSTVTSKRGGEILYFNWFPPFWLEPLSSVVSEWVLKRWFCHLKIRR